MSKLLTRSDAAQALGVSERTLDRLIRAGELSIVRVGRRVQIEQSSIEDYIERNREGGEEK